MDRFDLYERCVTNAGPLARFLEAVHGRGPRTLREDFSGSAALARTWAGEHGPAVAVDRDPEPLRKCRGVPRLRAIQSDVLGTRVRADIIAATNFPLGYWHTRGALLTYLRRVHACLNPGGVLVADTYGGSDAFVVQSTTRGLRGPDGEKIEYTWEQCAGVAHTARVLNAIHFRVTERGAKRAKVLRDAFVYDWRLWSVPELRDACSDAGFASVEVHDRLGGAIDHEGRLHVRAVEPEEPLDDPYVVYVVARR